MAVMCPTLFKPTGIPNLVRYLKVIAQHAPSTPFLYYDINVLTNVVCKYVNSFCSIYFHSSCFGFLSQISILVKLATNRLEK